MRELSSREKKIVRYVAAEIMSVAMVAVGVISGEMEVIFPEILALLTGFWMAEKQPWRVGSMGFVLLMSIAASVGVLITAYVPGGMYVQVLVAYVFVACMLMTAKSTFLPTVSACILPVLLGTKSLIYPAAVFIMSIIIVLVQVCMEIRGIRTAVPSPVADGREPNGKPVPNLPGALYPAADYDWKAEAGRWIGCFIVTAVMGAVAVRSGYVFLIAPPLVVVLATFATPGNQQMKAPWSFYAVTVACGLAGAVCRIVCCEMIGISMIIAAAVSTAIVLLIFYRSGKLFPPAAALSMLPYLIPAESLAVYPLLIAAGGAADILCGMAIERVINKKW